MIISDLKHSDFIVYIDESGDHSLDSINPEYPIFVLSFCIFEKHHYISSIVPSIRKLKFSTFGHDMVVLHEADIRRKRGAFAKLSKTNRDTFLDQITEIIHTSDFHLVAVVIDKRKLKNHYLQSSHPYHLALEFGLESISRFLLERKQERSLTHLVCEARGRKEDAELELVFRRICDDANYFQKSLSFELIIANKQTNSEGLQLADLTARPIGLSILKPEQNNRANAVLENKFYRNGYGIKDGFGLKVFP